MGFGNGVLAPFVFKSSAELHKRKKEKEIRQNFIYTPLKIEITYFSCFKTQPRYSKYILSFKYIIRF